MPIDNDSLVKWIGFAVTGIGATWRAVKTLRRTSEETSKAEPSELPERADGREDEDVMLTQRVNTVEQTVKSVEQTIRKVKHDMSELQREMNRCEREADRKHEETLGKMEDAVHRQEDIQSRIGNIEAEMRNSRTEIRTLTGDTRRIREVLDQLLLSFSQQGHRPS